MRDSTSRVRFRVAILCLIGALGCPLPVRHTELVTAEVMGIVRNADGAPASGIPVALAPSQTDVSCTKESARTITDSAGRFHFAAVHERKRILWLTLMEPLGGTGYRFCAGDAGVALPQQAAVMTSTYIMGWVRGDTLDCITWALRELAHVTCNGPINQHGMLTFGAWRDARDSGSYRLLLVDDDKWGYAKRAVVQWVALARPDASAGPGVRATLELPTVDAVQGATYALRDGRVVARVESVKPTKWNHRNWLAFELGGPGEARQVPDH